jgi:hypothetical protein
MRAWGGLENARAHVLRFGTRPPPRPRHARGAVCYSQPGGSSSHRACPGVVVSRPSAPLRLMSRLASLLVTSIALACGGVTAGSTSDAERERDGAVAGATGGKAGNTGGATSGGTTSGGGGSGGAGSGGAVGGSGAAGPDGCLQYGGEGGCGEFACPESGPLIVGHSLPGCCAAPVAGATKGCCGVLGGSLSALSLNFGLQGCTNVDAFRVSVTDPLDAECKPSCDPACPGLDVSGLFGFPARLVGCCRPDGTCGGTTASLPKLSQSVFGQTSACLSERDFNDAFAAAPVPWELAIPTPIACGTSP